MATDYTYPLGQYRGRKYHIHVHAEPDLNEIEAFSVTVYYNELPDETVEIARIDTAHGFTHFDKLYRRNTPKKKVDADCFEAEEQLRDNWRRYAESYRELHGDS
jgi:hypothetical protein